MSVRRIASKGAALALATLLLASAAPAVGQTPAGGSLYERLGRYDAIAAVVDEFLGRLLADPRLGRFFAGHGADSRARLRQRVVEQLCAAAGGPCVYTGRSMRAVHAGLGLTDAHWEAAVGHIMAALDARAVPPPARAELLALVAGLKADIVVEGGGSAAAAPVLPPEALRACLARGPESERCLDELFREFLKSHSTAAALAAIRRHEAADPALKLACHPVVHAVGRETFRLKGTIPDAFAACDQTCHSGCYHGAMERFLRGEAAPEHGAHGHGGVGSTAPG